MQSSDIEKVVNRETLKLTIAGGLLSLAGIGVIALEIARINDFIEPILLGRFGMAINTIMLVALFVASSRAITKKLIKSKQDEYSYHLDVESRAKAFNFLNYGILLIALLLGGSEMIATGLIVSLVGITWIIVARLGGRVNV